MLAQINESVVNFRGDAVASFHVEDDFESLHKSAICGCVGAARFLKLLDFLTDLIRRHLAAPDSADVLETELIAELLRVNLAGETVDFHAVRQRKRLGIEVSV